MTIGRDHYVIAFTMEPGRMYLWTLTQRLLRFASDLDGDMPMSRGHVAVKTRGEMKIEQVRASVRGTRAKPGSRHR